MSLIRTTSASLPPCSLKIGEHSPPLAPADLQQPKADQRCPHYWEAHELTWPSSTTPGRGSGLGRGGFGVSQTRTPVEGRTPPPTFFVRMFLAPSTPPGKECRSPGVSECRLALLRWPAERPWELPSPLTEAARRFLGPLPALLRRPPGERGYSAPRALGC